MRLTLLDKDRDSKSKACPSVYVSESGEFVVQGAELTARDRPALQDRIPGETAVRIAPEIVLRAIEKYKQNGAT